MEELESAAMSWPDCSADWGDVRMVRWGSSRWWASQISEWLGERRGEDVEAFLQIFRDYFFRFWKDYVVIFALIAIISITTAGAAWLVKDIVNNVFMDKNAALLLPLIFGVLAIFFVRGASTYLQIVRSTRISNAMVADIQRRLMQHILTQRVSFFEKNSSDNLLMRFNQGAQSFHSILNLVLVTGLRDFATLISLLAVMLIQDPMLTVVSFSVAPLVFYGLSVLLRRIKEFAKRELGGFQDLNRLVRELCKE
jgi:subfamily B ATP-binding cassette protein MsbA